VSRNGWLVRRDRVSATAGARSTSARSFRWRLRLQLDSERPISPARPQVRTPSQRYAAKRYKLTAMPRTSRTRHAQADGSRLWWIMLAVLFVGGLVMWSLGVAWGAALPGLSLIGFVVRAWLNVRPVGGHVHDSGLTAYGVSEAPRITPDQ
jgi:hypothetical protein